MSRFEEMRETKREGNGNLVSTEYIYIYILTKNKCSYIYIYIYITTFILG